MSTRWLKIVLLTLPLIGAAYYFGVICGQMSGAYDLVLFPSKEGLLLLLRMLLALGIVAVAAGIAAVLVAAYVGSHSLLLGLSGAGLLLGWEITRCSIVLAILYVATGIACVVGVEKELRQRIKFSVHAVSEGQSILLVVLLIVVVGSFYIGCAEHIKREGFSIPENYVAGLAEQTAKRVTLGIPAAEREAVQKEARQQFRRMLDDMLQELEPFERFIPLVVAVGLFTSLLTMIRLLNWLPMLIMGGAFGVLKAVGIAKVTAETVEVERLVLS